MRQSVINSKDGTLTKLLEKGEHEMPPAMKLTNHKNKPERPYTVYADFEATGYNYIDKEAHEKK